MYISRPPIFALATLAALGLAAAAPAHAQSLTLYSGDSAVVSGTGTVGTIGGTPVANTTSTYTDSAGTYYAVQTNGTSTLTLADGVTLSVGYEATGLDAEGSGAIAMTGGSISAGQYSFGLDAYGSSAVTVSGGSISTGENSIGIVAEGSGLVTVSGGSISAGTYGTGLGAYGSGPVTISGGAISAGFGGDGLDAEGNGSVTISGGSIGAGQNGFGLYAKGGGLVTVSGGSISAGDGGTGLFDVDSTLNLFSFGDSAFLIDGVAMNNTTLDGSLYQSGTDTISGILANGDVLNTTFLDAGTINLNIGTPPAAVPEASTTVSFGLLLMLGLGGAVLARKKRAAA